MMVLGLLLNLRLLLVTILRMGLLGVALQLVWRLLLVLALALRRRSLLVPLMRPLRLHHVRRAAVNLPSAEANPASC
jgi:hypothetical protein